MARKAKKTDRRPYFTAYSRVTGQRLGVGQFDNMSEARDLFGIYLGGGIEVRLSMEPTIALADGIVGGYHEL